MLEGTEGECSLWMGPGLVAEGVRDAEGPGTYGKEDWPGLLVVLWSSLFFVCVFFLLEEAKVVSFLFSTYPLLNIHLSVF